MTTSNRAFQALSFWSAVVIFTCVSWCAGGSPVSATKADRSVALDVERGVRFADVDTTKFHAYPLPFCPDESEELHFVVKADRAGQQVRIEIFTLYGHSVWSGDTEAIDSGWTTTKPGWSGRNKSGDLAASGGYVCRVTVGGRSEVFKIGIQR